MAEEINESVSVNLLNAVPTSLSWHGRDYTLTQIGLHHTVRNGRTLIHIFSATDGNTCFKLLFDTDSLRWKLLEIYV
jgi:hypothetical protein